MYEFRVGAYRNDVGTGFLKLVVQLCQSGELRCSDKGKIRRIKEEDRPSLLLSLCTEAHLSEIALFGFVGLDLKVRDVLTNSHTATMLTHDYSSFVMKNITLASGFQRERMNFPPPPIPGSHYRRFLNLITYSSQAKAVY